MDFSNSMKGGAAMIRYPLEDRVRCATGQTGTVKQVYGVPECIVYIVRSDDGNYLERFEEELTPADISVTAGLK